MTGPPEAAAGRTGPQPGLCGVCRHSRLIRTARGSIFRLCERSASDPQFPRYPNLPVVQCVGFEPALGP